jgi:tryptophanyl-tRNA synthetase
MIRKEGARVMSLTDGRNKMSKSDPSEMSRINILDSPDVIAKKIKRCKTDLVKGLSFDDPERPMLTEVTIESLKPIQEKYAQIREDKDYLATVLRQGRLKAEAVANQTLDRVKNAMGYLPPF